MKFIVFIVTLIFVYSQTVRGEGFVGVPFLVNSPENFISNCKANGLTQEGEENIKKAFIEYGNCNSKKQLYSVSEEEYIENIIHCSKEVNKLTKACLKEDQKYFPDLLLQMRRSLTSFLYADKELIGSSDVIDCGKTIQQQHIKEELKECTKEVAKGTNTTIPGDKSVTCKFFINSNNCQSTIMTKYCNVTPKVKNYIDDYVKAAIESCK